MACLLLGLSACQPSGSEQGTTAPTDATTGGGGGRSDGGAPDAQVAQRGTCDAPPVASGALRNDVSDVDFTGEPVDARVEHKLDIDADEDGCVVAARFTLRKANLGCELTLTYTSVDTHPLALTEAHLSADSFCPGWSDADEGDYVLAGGTSGLDFVARVPDRTAQSSCIGAVTVRFRGGALLRRADGRELSVELGTLSVTGDFASVGNTDATCPCAQRCGDRACGPDPVCGFACGACAGGDLCDEAGQCVCPPQCAGRDCGPDGCGGTCGDGCGEGGRCDEARGRCGCDPGLHACAGGCRPEDDPAACGEACALCPSPDHGRAVCAAGSCRADCDAGFHACGGRCAPDDAEATCGDRCGPCPEPQDGRAICDAGTCGVVCRAGFHACGDQCLSDDAAESCGHRCDPCVGAASGNAVCEDRECAVTCDPGYRFCGGACARCSQPGARDYTCNGKQCVALTCRPGQHACDGRCVDDDSTSTCGDRCTPCPSPRNGSRTCVDGVCGISCQPQHYLACGEACAACGGGNLEARCDGDRCESLVCRDSYHLCPDGHCAHDREPTACGPDCRACPTIENASASCEEGGVCGIRCLNGFHRCGPDCVPDDDATACGAACAACATDAHGEASCLGGGCALSCEQGFLLCEGACAPCPGTAATTRCAGATCVAATCAADQFPCVDGCCPFVLEPVQAGPGQPGGGWPSIAIHPDGRPRAVWHDSRIHALVYGVRGAAGWAIETVDDTADVGQYASLALDAAGHPHVAYRDNENRDLKYAHDAGQGWVIEPVEQAGDTGTHASIAVTPQGVPHIAFHRPSGRTLGYATRGPDGWDIITLGDAAAGQGTYASIALSPTTGLPGIAYRNDTLTGLAYAHRSAAFWLTDNVDFEFDDVGASSRLAFDAEGMAHIAYRNESDRVLMLASKGQFGWPKQVVDADGNTGRENAIAVDTLGRVHVLYAAQTAGGVAALRYAVRTGDTWTVGEHLGSASYPTLALDAQGRPHMMYRAPDNIYYVH